MSVKGTFSHDQFMTAWGWLKLFAAIFCAILLIPVALFTILASARADRSR